MTQYASSSSQAFLDSQLSPISQSAFRTTKHHCDGPGCKATFSNLVEFEAHREDPSVPHEWCDKCKEWCKDWDDFVKHKATSSDHLSCPNCGKDFKSVGGIELHLKQQHPRNKEILCKGCRRMFASYASIVAHLEKGRCPVHTIDKYEAGVARKEIIRKIITEEDCYKPDEHENAFATPSTRAGSTISDNNAGNSSSILESGPTQMKGKTPLRPMAKTSKTANKPKVPEISILDMEIEEWPNPDKPVLFPVWQTKNFPFEEEDTEGTDGNGVSTDWDRFDNLTLEGKRSIASPATPASTTTANTSSPASATTWTGAPGAWSNESRTARLFPDSPASTNSSRSSPISPASITYDTSVETVEYRDSTAEYRPFSTTDARGQVHTVNLFTVKLYDEAWMPDNANFDAEQFFNILIQKYLCPFPKCNHSFEEPSTLSDHLTYQHAPSETRCPKCQRKFKSRAGILAHVESGKCGIKEGGRLYERVVDELSGGFVGLKEGDRERGGSGKGVARVPRW